MHSEAGDFVLEVDGDQLAVLDDSVAEKMIKEECPDKNVYVLNSYSTAGGMVLIARMADKLIGEGLHNGKSHTASFVFRIGGKKRLSCDLSVLYSAPAILYLYPHHALLVKPDIYVYHTDSILVSVDDTVCDSFGNGGFDVADFFESWV